MILQPTVSGSTDRGLNRILNQSAERSLVLLAQDLSHWYVSVLAAEVNLAAAAQSYKLIALDFHRSKERERNLLYAILDSNVLGCIFLWDHFPENLDLYAQIVKKCACIQIGDPKPIPGLDCIRADDYGGAAAAVNHLIAAGYHQIGHLTLDTPMEAVAERRRAFLDTLEQSHLPINRQWILSLPYGLTDADRRRREPMLRAFLTQPHLPRALFICSDWLASETIESMHELGLQIPDDIALVGFDDALPYALTSIPLSTIHIDTRQQAQLSVERLLFRLKQGKHQGPAQVTRIPAALIVRASSVQVRSSSHRWECVMRYTLDHYREDLTVQGIAALLGFDANYFSHQFRQLFGKRFTDHVNHLRLKYSSELLLTTEFTVERVAHDAGFKSVNHFHSLFKRSYGVSPHAYRKQQTFE